MHVTLGRWMSITQPRSRRRHRAPGRGGDAIDQRVQLKRFSADRRVDYGAAVDWEDRLHHQLGLSDTV